MSARHLATRTALGLAVLAMPATASASDDPVHDAPYPSPAHFTLRAEGGPTYRSLYGIDVGAGSLSFGAGAETRGGSFGGGLFGVFGETEAGLRLAQWGVSGEASWFVGDRVRLGVLPRFGWMELDRFTTGSSAEAFTVGLAGRASVDLVRESGLAVAIGLEPAIDTSIAIDLYTRDGDNDAGLLLPSIGAFVQVRYRFARDPVLPSTTTAPTSERPESPAAQTPHAPTEGPQPPPEPATQPTLPAQPTQPPEPAEPAPTESVPTEPAQTL